MIFSIIYPLVLYFPHYSLLLLLHILRDAIIFLSSGNVWLPDNDTRKIVQWETTHGFSKIFWVLENVGEEIEKLEHLCTIGEKIKCKMVSVQLSSVQSLSHVQLFVTPWIAARQASLSITNSWSLLKHMSIESMMPSSHLILCRPLLLLPPIPPSIRVFSNESTLCMRWPKYWSFSFSISPSNEHPGLICLRMDWLDLLAVQPLWKTRPWADICTTMSTEELFKIPKRWKQPLSTHRWVDKPM